MADESPKLKFKRIHEGQASAEVSVNENFNEVETLLQAGIVDRDLSAAPKGVNGNAYIVAGTPAGGDPWENHGNDIAAYYDGWVFFTPLEGWRVWVNDEDLEVFFDGTNWTAVAQRDSHKTGITAFAGGGQASATAILHEINRVTTVATAGDSVKLPAASPGMRITLINAGASIMDVFPSTGEEIDGLGMDTQYPMIAGDVTTFFCAASGQWDSLEGA